MGLSLPAPVWKKPIMHQNDASALSPSFFVVGQFFLYLTFPLLLRLAVYFEYVFLIMPSKWTLQIAPGTKFLRHLGSQCARAHPGKSRKIKKNKIQEENQKCDCQTILYGAIPSKYIDWLIDWYWNKMWQGDRWSNKQVMQSIHRQTQAKRWSHPKLVQRHRANLLFLRINK